jgi:hypothetical protein
MITVECNHSHGGDSPCSQGVQSLWENKAKSRLHEEVDENEEINPHPFASRARESEKQNDLLKDTQLIKGQHGMTLRSIMISISCLSSVQWSSVESISE